VERSGSSMRNWYLSSDWVKFAIQLPQENNPGDVFNYNSSTSHLLSVILSKSTKPARWILQRKTFLNRWGYNQPIGIKTRKDTILAVSVWAFQHEILAKFGFLYLNNGYWNGQSIVSESWVKESTGQQIQAVSHPIYGKFGYGYQWWVKKVDGCNSFRAWGRRGQFIVVVPELDLVIAVTSKTAQPHPPTSIHYNPLFDLVAAAVQRKRPPKKPLKPWNCPLM
jgi:CubicO group peptidase (beta-lactamase class C family)